eukprot:symbB.v1.2.012961.t1/scaffold906.1/size153294/6
MTQPVLQGHHPSLLKGVCQAPVKCAESSPSPCRVPRRESVGPTWRMRTVTSWPIRQKWQKSVHQVSPVSLEITDAG